MDIQDDDLFVYFTEIGEDELFECFTKIGTDREADHGAASSSLQGIQSAMKRNVWTIFGDSLTMAIFVKFFFAMFHT